MIDSGIDRRVSERVARLLKRRDMTRVQLADAIGINKATVSDRLRGRTRWPLGDVLAVAEALGVRDPRALWQEEPSC
jgi:transcriptional regulator with XRE-family HTH domain